LGSGVVILWLTFSSPYAPPCYSRWQVYLGSQSNFDLDAGAGDGSLGGAVLGGPVVSVGGWPLPGAGVVLGHVGLLAPDSAHARHPWLVAPGSLAPLLHDCGGSTWGPPLLWLITCFLAIFSSSLICSLITPPLSLIYPFKYSKYIQIDK